MNGSQKRAGPFGMMVLTAVIWAAPPTASAQTYPERTINVILPYSAGSGADFAGRVTMPKLSELVKQNIVIENRPGSSGIPGTLAAAKATPDGYTLLFSATQQVITPNLYKSLPYNMGKDFIPISRLTYHALPLAVSTTLPVNTLEELVAYVKARPGKLNYGSTGMGTSIHMMGAYFVHLAGLEMTHVPYSKTADAVVGLGRGDVQLMFYGQNGLQAEIDSGRVKLLATSGAERAAWAKHLPAVKELYPDYVLYSWHGLFAPANTPRSVVEILNKALKQVAADPEVRERFSRAGTSANHLGGPELERFVSDEIARYQQIVKLAGLQPR
jgi:tripartite-type tricarboxylate transporter receptor subunit TctC